MLELSHVSVRRGQRKVVDGLSLCLSGPQFVAVLGENGAGKSTLLRAIAGDLPFSGDISLQGCSLRHWSAARLARMRAVMEQQFSPPAQMSVLEMVTLGRYGHDECDKEARLHAQKWLGYTHLSEYAHREVASLSGGEQQRVQLARCLAQLDGDSGGQKLLLLDEPTSALDLYHQHACLQLVRAFTEAGHLVIAVMHDVNLASLYADQILLLKNGKRIIQGPPQQVLQPDTLKSAYQINSHITPHPILTVPMVFSMPG
ncbi:heme ABC transporter ATP-binding protein [Aliiglaciecola sp. CAU 1673]|uniref:heme ABC transporter ATP-binding protein n=1 Tax=Aliiglaciecola sp. CAU 1673 TaxID=3032595 RepID=UPI0023DC7BC3|nr:heme ABC transporter ATP-binding protein [Aliiglaciecola sp. CAU 1673]MDF2180146.1 heme ABC transporter ATP-binding protein [Aliiglaciecola sp. CAU 1673]